jgi:hypothetical protein
MLFLSGGRDGDFLALMNEIWKGRNIADIGSQMGAYAEVHRRVAEGVHISLKDNDASAEARALETLYFRAKAIAGGVEPGTLIEETRTIFNRLAAGDTPDPARLTHLRNVFREAAGYDLSGRLTSVSDLVQDYQWSFRDAALAVSSYLSDNLGVARANCWASGRPYTVRQRGETAHPVAA